jgi:hypothetical protein
MAKQQKVKWIATITVTDTVVEGKKPFKAKDIKAVVTPIDLPGGLTAKVKVVPTE